MRTDKEAMLEDMRQSKDFCMTTIFACKKILAENGNIKVKDYVAILAGLAEIKKVIKDYFGSI